MDAGDPTLIPGCCVNPLSASTVCRPQAEAEAYWCFVGLLEHRKLVFSSFPTGLWNHMAAVHRLLETVDPVLSAALRRANEGSTEFPFLFQAVFLLLKRELLGYEATSRVWEASLAARDPVYDLALIAALVRLHRQEVLALYSIYSTYVHIW